ncbi:hypothetical protein V7183_18690 [Bacillus sp. JJ1127]|uniref:hypothetical protein n=1 Tax=Bacillus sp. JJ1127 TaxID=3122952 RepID=UPI002FFE14AD
MKLAGIDTFNGINKQGGLYMSLLNLVDNLGDKIKDFEAAYNELTIESEDEIQMEIITSRLSDFYSDLEKCKTRLVGIAKSFTLEEIRYFHANYKSYKG